MTEVAVMICSYNGKQFMDGCLGTVLASHDPGIRRHVVLVDDASTDDTGAYVSARFPGVDVIRLERNAGFGGANNSGWQYIQQTYPSAQYVVLLNADTEVESGWLVPLVRTLEEHPDVGAVQSKLRLHPAMDRLNTAGNRCHFLGFGFLVGYDEIDVGQYDRVRSIDFASGAAVMLRTSLLKELGLFDAALYMYLDDTELSWKFRLSGYDSWLAPESIVYHKYRATAPFRYYYYLERNRWLLLLTYYHLASLILLLPALALMELGQLLFASFRGKLWDKLRSYGYFLRWQNIRFTWRRRREAQRRRKIRDRDFLGRFAGVIQFGPIDHPLLTYVGNPLLGAYWSVARRLIWW